jgi:hypothetical protein
VQRAVRRDSDDCHRPRRRVAHHRDRGKPARRATPA